MSPAKHLIAGTVLGASAYLLTANPYHSLAIGAGACVIDVDHLLDYSKEWEVKGAIRRIIGQVPGGTPDNCPRRTYKVLHGWDLLLGLLIIFFFHRNFYLLSFVLGAAVHLMMDQLGNSAHPLRYFLTYRLWHRFRTEAFLDGTVSLNGGGTTIEIKPE